MAFSQRALPHFALASGREQLSGYCALRKVLPFACKPKSCNTTLTLSGWVTVRQALSSGMPLLWEISQHSANQWSTQGWQGIPIQRRAFIPDGMVRFSRLLGNSDTTAHGTSAQVSGKSTVIQSGNQKSAWGARFFSDAQNAASRRSGVLRFRAGHWPPSKLWPMVLSTGPIARRPRMDVPLYSGPLVGGVS